MNLIKKQSSFLPFIFDEFFKNNWNINTPLNSIHEPSYNVKENDKEFVLELIAPGKINDDFKVEIDNRLLSISMSDNIQESDYNYNLKEFEFLSFEKSFELPKTIDIDKVKSTYHSGILLINLPKKKEFQNPIKKIINVK
jgi:HSP20 family protein